MSTLQFSKETDKSTFHALQAIMPVSKRGQRDLLALDIEIWQSKGGTIKKLPDQAAPTPAKSFRVLFAIPTSRPVRVIHTAEASGKVRNMARYVQRMSYPVVRVA